MNEEQFIYECEEFYQQLHDLIKTSEVAPIVLAASLMRSCAELAVCQKDQDKALKDILYGIEFEYMNFRVQLLN